MSERPSHFLTVVSPEEAARRWWEAVRPAPGPPERVPLAELRGRRLAAPIVATLDVPGFDRANVDGFAVVAADTYGASELAPRRLRLLPEEIAAGVAPQVEVVPGSAATIATGGVIPRGADAVVMLEDTDLDPQGPATLLVRRPATPGARIAFVGSDITRGEVVLRPGVRLGPRETGVIAALGQDHALVHPRPRVAVLSTGDEIVPPGAPRPLGAVHDANQSMIADTCAELGALVTRCGIVADDAEALRTALLAAIDGHDLVLLSGGTSKGAGDLDVGALAELPGPEPGQKAILVHGVAVKPGKPLCLAASRTERGAVVPIAALPGFPTSALFTLHELVLPLLRALAGEPPAPPRRLRARLPQAVASERGRREYVLVQLLAAGPPGDLPAALPLGKGSGSVTAFARADGFFAVPQLQERVEAGEEVEVERIDEGEEPPDLLIVGSHCTGLERIADRLHAEGLRVRLVAQGSQGGLAAAERGLCDVAPIHLCDPATGEYNAPFVPPECVLVPGYRRMQGLVSRLGDARFTCPPGQAPFALPLAVFDPAVLMVNRNRGSGTRVLVDRLLDPHRARGRPRGYHHEARSHQGVAASVAQGRADWGIAIANVAEGLAFAPIAAERYDFVIPRARLGRPALRRFLAALADPALRARLRADGFSLDDPLQLPAGLDP